MSEWISIKNKLPELHEYVLVHYEPAENGTLYKDGYGVAQLVLIGKSIQYWTLCDDARDAAEDPENTCLHGKVTHWMSLPNPPKPSDS